MAELSRLLPGYNCGECGHRQCKDYAEEISMKGDFSKCPHLELERFVDTRADIKEFLASHISVRDEVESLPSACLSCDAGNVILKGDLKVDFSLGPLRGESSCREDLYPLSRQSDIEAGDILRYRALGCPVIHFAEVMKYSQGLATVHLAGPHQLLSDKFYYKDVGICMVTGFEGSVANGRIPDVGETVRFLPSHCRMQQVHSGVVVHSGGDRLRIEGIDLKVWR